MPWLIGLLALLCLAGAAALTVTLLGIRPPRGLRADRGPADGLLPATAATFSYMFTADAYFFGLFLAALGAYWTVRFPRAGIPAGSRGHHLLPGHLSELLPRGRGAAGWARCCWRPWQAAGPAGA